MNKASVVVLFVLLCISCSSSRERAEKPTATGSVGTVRAALTTGDYKTQVLGDGAVGYWRLGDTGPDALDSAPRGNKGKYIGTYSDSPPPNQNQPGALLGESDTSAQFYVSNNYNHNPVTQSNWVQVPTDPNQSPTTASLSVEGWFTVTRGSTLQTYATILVKTTSNMGDGYGLYWYSNALYFYVNKYNYRVGIPASAMGDLSLFHHVVGTYDGTNINIYYDGNLADSYPLTAAMGKGNPVNAPAVDITIGRGWGLSWGGRLDEIAIYPNALSAAQVLSHFQAARPPGPLSRAFVAYAQQSLTFGTGDHVVGGDVGVASQASQSAGPQLVVGASDAFDAQRGVFAPSVSLGPQSQVGMVNVSPNGLTNPNDQGLFGAQQPFPTSMPLLPLVQSGAPGTTNITIASGRTQTVYPGNYGALVVNGTALLPPGSYSFSSINVGAGGVISPRQPGNTTVRVDTTLTMGTGATLFQQGRIAGAFVISVAGTDSSSSAPAVSVGANSVVEAVINAPRGTVSIGDGSTVIGAMSAFAINVGNNVTMTLDGGATAVADAPVGQQKLSGYVTPEMAAAPLVGPMPRSTTVVLSVTLPVRTPDPADPARFPSLGDFVKQVSDPTNARFRHFLQDTDYNKYYRPSDNDYNTLKSFATSAGLSIVNTYNDQELIDVSAPVGLIEPMLHANMNLYQHADGTTFYALDRNPSIDLAPAVLHISGTNNYRIASPSLTGIANAQFFGNDFRNTYVPSCTTGPSALDGTGQSIAILILEDFNWSDIQKYDSTASIPDPNIGVAIWDPLNRFVQGDPTAILVSAFDPITGPNGALEAPMDIEMAHAMAPGADIFVYMAPNATGGGIVHDYETDTVHAAAHPPGGWPRSNQVSTSWNMALDDGISQSIQEMAAFGQSFIATSGDGGSATADPEDIRAYDNVTLVGGTNIILPSTIVPGAQPPTPPQEAVWVAAAGLPPGSSGGGFMGPYTAFCGIADAYCTGGISAPYYQKDLSRFGNASQQWRSYPDISMLATNMEIFITSGGATGQAFSGQGTSAAGPLFAGFMALVNERARRDFGMPPVGFINPALYAIGESSLASSCFNDVRMGSAPHISTDSTVAIGDNPLPNGGFPATPGYDMATGWGTPTCALVNQLASPTPTVLVPPPPSPSAFPSFAGFDRQDTCALNMNVGNLQCWGTNTNGQNGTDANEVDMTPNMTPVCPAIYQDGIAVRGTASGEGFTCAIKMDDSVWCWGDNSFGQLGPSAPQSPGVPVRHTGISTDDPPVQLAAGGSTACVVTRAGNVWCWGKNDKGQLGNNKTGTTPNPQPWQVLLGALGPAQQVSVAPLVGDHACALLASGNVACWGGAGDSTTVLGSGSAGGSATPVVVQTAAFSSGSLSGAIYVSVGYNHACAVVGASTGGGLFCWGDNGAGELGQGVPGDTELVATPATVVSQNLVGVACGGLFTCTLTSTGDVECFGENDVGQVNSNTSPGVQLTPLPPVALSSAGAILAGYNRACSLLNPGGSVKCWGSGPIGDGTNNLANLPTPVAFSRCF